MLTGRERERRHIERALETARAGASSVLALVGEPGIGKTALLDHAAGQAEGMRVLRARGVESEAQIPFAGLLELIRPALIKLDQIPEPQAVALAGALALAPGSAQQRFAIGAATLSLLAAYGDEGPLVLLVDDVQWLDRPSAQSLLFAVRRLVADPVAVLIAVRAGEPSLLDGADLPSVHLSGLTSDQAAQLLSDIDAETARRLYEATGGNPLALLELAAHPHALALAPEGAPLPVPNTIAQAFLRRVQTLDDRTRRALVLAATSESGDLAVLERAGGRIGVELAHLGHAEAAGLVRLGPGTVEFRHPLVRSAIYTDASGLERREAHRALAAALPDRDIDRRAWHLAAAAVGTDDAACAALEQAGTRSRDRSAYSTAAAAFEQAGRLSADSERRAGLLLRAAQCAWLAGSPDLALALLARARAETGDPAKLLGIAQLEGHIATRCGPVMRGYAILTAAAGEAPTEQAVAMLSDATWACFLAGEPLEGLAVAERALAQIAPDSSIRSRFLAFSATGAARILGGDAATGAEVLQAAIVLAESSAVLRDDLELAAWLTVGPMFLRESGTGRPLLEHALTRAREQSAVGVLPSVLNLLARDEATSDRYSVADATYREAIALARESGQQCELAFGLAGLAWLQARRGVDSECRALAAEALALAQALGTRIYEVWVAAALGELELGLGEAARALEQFEHQSELVLQLQVTDVDLWPGAELVDAYTRLGRQDEAQQMSERYLAAAEDKGQPWSLARALRSRGMVGNDGCFAEALALHERTPDTFEQARTALAYGEQLRRGRNRVRAREQLRHALEIFERLGAQLWAERARSELAASGERLRRRDPTSTDELTPQELQIALLLASGKTTREAAAALFLSPKTIEYHLRHVYLKLDVHSREALAQELIGSSGGPLPAT